MSDPEVSVLMQQSESQENVQHSVRVLCAKFEQQNNAQHPELHQDESSVKKQQERSGQSEGARCDEERRKEQDNGESDHGGSERERVTTIDKCLSREL